MKLKLHQTVSEESLLKACQSGDINAQKSLFDRYAPLMLAICRRYIKDTDDAEDVMITGFAKIFEKLDQFREEGSFEGWMKRLMVNEALGYLRKNKNLHLQVSIEEDYQLSDDRIGDQLEADDLMELISSLPDGYRAVFNLYAIEGFSHKEIAEKLNISENTSKSQLSRARDFLKRKIAQLENTINYKVVNNEKSGI